MIIVLVLHPAVISIAEVTLPRAFNEDEAFKVSINKVTTGIAKYRKTFTVPALPPTIDGSRATEGSLPHRD